MATRKTKAKAAALKPVGKGSSRKTSAKSVDVPAVVPPLSEIRARIDGIDNRLLELLSERARLAQVVGQSKRQQENISTADLYRPERESNPPRSSHSP